MSVMVRPASPHIDRPPRCITAIRRWTDVDITLSYLKWNVALFSIMLKFTMNAGKCIHTYIWLGGTRVLVDEVGGLASDGRGGVLLQTVVAK